MTKSRTSSGRSRAGFTLAELLVVMGIIAILTAVSVPVFARQAEQARKTRARAEARMVCMAIWMYLLDLDAQGIHPESWELMMELGDSLQSVKDSSLQTYLDSELLGEADIYSIYYSDTLESYEGILCEIDGYEVEALVSGRTEIVGESR